MASKMQVFSCSDAEKCASIVKRGGVVVFPTDTIYGIGCDPYNDAAVKRIFRIKGRDEKKPLPVLAYSAQDAEKLIALGRTGACQEILARCPHHRGAYYGQQQDIAHRHCREHELGSKSPGQQMRVIIAEALQVSCRNKRKPVRTKVVEEREGGSWFQAGRI